MLDTEAPAHQATPSETMTPSPLFVSKSGEKPRLLSISFASDPAGSLGAQLLNHDKGSPTEMFTPGYASVGRLVEGETVARKCGVKVGDVIVAVNGEGFRRFKPEHKDEDLDDVTSGMEGMGLKELDDKAREVKATVIAGKQDGEHYAALLGKIKSVKKAADPESPLLLSLERYDWDSRVNSWTRFLVAREGDVPAAMQMIQQHEAWRESHFPIDLTNQGLQDVLKAKAVAEIDVDHEGLPPTVYVSFSKLQALESDHSPSDVVDAFVIFTEELLSRAANPRHPKTSQFIDLSGVSITSGLRLDILKKVYAAFEPNYPETLHKMVMYPVSKVTRQLARGLLSFVNENTKKKFVITDDLDTVCTELGWDKAEVEACGGVTNFMHKHEKHGSTMIF